MDLALRNDLRPPRQEQVQELERLGLEVPLLAAAEELTGGAVESESPKCSRMASRPAPGVVPDSAPR